jgi:hypothetical protein
VSVAVAPWTLAFDPWAWLVWGRDVTRLALDTSAGPSWKPLPVVATTPFALSGDAAPALWLIVARAGGVLALVGAAVLGARLAGRAAGIAAAAVVAVSPWWLFNTALGNSEGLLVAAILWAVVAHLAGRPGAALALGAAAALLRPEVWLFLAAYGVWCWRTGGRLRRGVVAAAVAVPVLWFGPDAAGIGGAVLASEAARGEPSPGSAGLADVPGLAVLGDAIEIATVPGALAALAALAIAARRRGRRRPRGRAVGVAGGRGNDGLSRARRVDSGLALALAAGALAWIAIVAVMAQAGYAGNPRYLVAAGGVTAVLAGAGAAALLGRTGAVVLVAAALATSISSLADQVRDLDDRADRRAAFGSLLARAGGAQRLLDCSRIRTQTDLRTFVGWELDLPLLALERRPRPPAVVLRARPFTGEPIGPDLGQNRSAYRLLARVPGWEAWAACGPAPQVAGAANVTVTRSKPSPRIMPSSIERVFASAVRSRSGFSRAASKSLRSASW